MNAYSSTRSVYSSALHLLSPTSLGSCPSSPSQLGPQSPSDTNSVSSSPPPGYDLINAEVPRDSVSRPSISPTSTETSSPRQVSISSLSSPSLSPSVASQSLRTSSSAFDPLARRRLPLSEPNSQGASYHRPRPHSGSLGSVARRSPTTSGLPDLRCTPFISSRYSDATFTSFGPSSSFYAPTTPSPPERLLSCRSTTRGPAYSFLAGSDDANAYKDSGSGHEVLSEIIMGLDMDKDGRVGCAYYVVMDEALYLEEDAVIGGTDAVATLVLQVQPTTVIVPNRAPGPLIELLERDAQRLDDEVSDSEQGSYILRHLVSAEFDYDAGKEMLADLDLESYVPDTVQILPREDDDPAHCISSSRHGKLMRLAQSIGLDSYLSIGCAGAVLSDIDRRRAAEDISPDSGTTTPFRTRSVTMNRPTNTMLVSADALVSLQILRSELHPNPQTHYSNSSEAKAKESVSVYGLLQALASTAQGKARLRQMIFRPSTDIELIQERQRTIAVFLRPENRESVMAIRKLLRKVKNTKALLCYVKKGVDRIRGKLSIRTGDWRALLRFAMVSAEIRETIPSLSVDSGVALFSKIYDHIDSHVFMSLGELILETIDFKLSTESGRTEILQGASEELDDFRRIFSHVCQMLPNAKESAQRELPSWAAQYVHYCTILPELGFLLAVTLNPETGEGVYHGQDAAADDWHIKFINGDLVHYKNTAMLDLDSQYGDLPSQIANEEMKVIMGLATAVLKQEPAIIAASELFGELDTLLALASAAEKYRWTATRMTCANVIDIVDGRHPLQELLVPSFIPNGCILAGGRGTDCTEGNPPPDDENGVEQPSMMVLTGPNNSGKSIYMKQVAIIVYLAHIGSYVPASRATIGVTDRILTRIATRETVIDEESAFLVDLKQAAITMNFATRQSLVLADEFGKGTSMEIGAALFAAYLAHFLDLGEERPKVLVGTHFHDVFENGLLVSEDNVAFAHMGVRADPEGEDPEDQITFLFQLLPGRDTASLGILCAAINDVESEVVERAQALVLFEEKNEDLKEVCTRFSDEDIRRLRPAERIARRFLAWRIPKHNTLSNESVPLRDMIRSLMPESDRDGLDT